MKGRSPEFPFVETAMSVTEKTAMMETRPLATAARLIV
jgi:hypothetical protein